MNNGLAQEPIACTLSGADLKARLQRIAELGKRHLQSQQQDGSRIHLHYSLQAAGELREIVGLEQECCSFLDFDLRETASGIDLTITAPASAGEIAPTLFEHFAGATGRPTSCAPTCGCSGSKL
jgi:hypothetical protein